MCGFICILSVSEIECLIMAVILYKDQ